MQAAQYLDKDIPNFLARKHLSTNPMLLNANYYILSINKFYIAMQ